ncbi:MAG: S8 family peptidase [Ignavibacteriales bacterium]|nr:MAG: S8 family peptidase [Ignavibacteriales bacterium]
MKLILVAALILITSTGISQQKYLIYFKDKGVERGTTLNKTDQAYLDAINLLSERSIERRKSVLGEEFIQYEDIPVRQYYIDVLSRMGIQVLNKLSWFNAVSAYLTDDQLTSVKDLGFVDKIEKVKKLIREDDFDLNYQHAFKTSVDTTIYGSSYTQLKISDIPLVHAKGITGSGVIVGMLDSGFDWQRHESLQNQNILDEYDFIFNDTITANEPEDNINQHGHGTYTFSIIGGYKENSLIGAAYGSSFLLAKTEDIRSELHVEEDNYAAALIWMEARGVDITSSSLGYANDFTSGDDYRYSDMNGRTTIVTKAAELSFNRGVITITAAGNEGDDPWHYITAPSDGFNTIGVGAVNSNNQVAAFSGYGPSYDGRIKPEVVAMGVSVLGASANTTDSYGFSSGTSAATPILAGIAALLKSVYPLLDNKQVRNILIESGDNLLNPDDRRGYGLVSATRAISFPNLQRSFNDYQLNKIFLERESIDPSSVRIHLATNDTSFSNYEMYYDGNLKHAFSVFLYGQGQEIKFYFTYSDSSGNQFREPEQNEYKFKYGSLNVSLNYDPVIPISYDILSQNYPNPFNNSTTINFIAKANERAELIIIDAIGQKVKVMSQLTSEGENTFNWNGTNEFNVQAASGVYYYILRLSGREYAKKMILMK